MTYHRILGLATLASVAALASTASAHDDRLDQITAFLSQANVVSGPEIVDCALSLETETTCFRITVTPTPRDLTPGAVVA